MSRCHMLGSRTLQWEWWFVLSWALTITTSGMMLCACSLLRDHAIAHHVYQSEQQLTLPVLCLQHGVEPATPVQL